ncbi:MAG: RpiB/LacA/LacB family sugar-phosphate isomerase [Bacteroidia bacterium]|nr:RpiB/LacA/LacB family sugar-phosphate isomerase [Bacteroidia bacterium]
MKKVIIASDHAGFELKEHLKNAFAHIIEFTDIGTHSPASIDYPDVVHPLCENVFQYDFGILICGSGNGVCITANKHKGIRAALAWKPEIAALAKQHNNANILCLPARFISFEEAENILHSFMQATFEGGRHQNRISKIEMI